jgi:outer membrane receptor protein involved in Fe transport
MSGLGRTLLLVGGIVALSWARPLHAQTTTASVRGYVRDSSGGVLVGANLEARNTATGAQRAATTQADGGYTFSGLVPGVYEIVVRHIGHSPQGRRLTVQIGATLSLDFALAAGAVQLAAVTVEAPTVEMRTSEVATNVTQQQIQALPTPSRNFLDLAGLAPGVQVSEDRVNGTGFRSFAAGGGSANTVNVFVDGASLKNDLTAGGVSGQDASRGNPFPRNAIQEYRVITQNFKAEYQKASSAIISATTKSGTNVWTGSVEFGYQNKGLVARDTFQIRDNITKPDYTRSLPSISIGGPIQRDHIFFFGSYEGNYQNRDNLVSFTPPSGFAALDSVNLAQFNGSFTSPFRETLLFGKLTDNLSPHSSAELSFSNRHETDVRDFGGTNAFQTAVNFRQNVSTGILKYSYFSGPWLNEAAVIYDRAQRNPSPNEPGTAARQFHYPSQTVTIGSNLSTQDFTQRRLGFRNDLTYTGIAGHVFKGGVTVDLVHYNIIKANNETPLFEYADTVGLNCWCRTGDTTQGPELFNYRSPYQLTYATGIPGITTNNNQIGAYIQDDWSPTQRLTLNLGIRWDYESRMLNTDYVTPANVVSFLNTYNDSLAVPLDLNRYISNGHNRSPFLGAFQPRLGFSYGLDPENKTTVFGGLGIYYDRSIFDFSVDEIQKLTRPTYRVRFADPDSTASGQYVQWQDSYLTADTTTLNTLVKSTGLPEAFLIDNKMKPPKSTQFSLGVRHMLGASLVGSITYQGQRGTNLFTYNWANHTLHPDGSCCIDYNGLAAHGFNNIIYSTEDGKTWYDAVSLDLNRPYRRTSARFGYGWGVTYTYAKRAIAGLDNLGDASSSFPQAYPTAGLVGKHDSNDGNDERHHVVANWIMDLPYLYGVQFSGLITLGSGGKLDIGCPARFCGPATYINGGFTPPHYSFLIPGKLWAYRRVDVRLRKDFPNVSGTQVGVTLDLFNAFNYQNFGCYDTGYGTPNPNLGKAFCVVSDPRRAQFGVAYNF